MQTAVDSSVEVRTGVKVNSVDTAGTAIVLADGETISADIIIAADGLHVSGQPFQSSLLYNQCIDCSSVRCQIPCSQ